ncbi:hypothetical protein B0H11DRAFT_2168855 [Mycena galericulata]|nr:hypothetical protein B0H11DRAFT_2168855 [Mycena galericulata]
MSTPANITKRLHISFTPSVPSSGAEELTKSLTAHFGKFGTVKSVDGLGKLDGVGVPRKFGFVSIEGPEASITKCVNSLSGSIWKGVKVRVGDARPDFDQRIAQENAADPPPPRRKRKRGGVHAEDMTLITPETAAERAGWKVSELGRVTRPIRIRPAHPLPPPLATSLPKPKKSKDKDATKAKPKKRRDPDSRARRRTIDMTRWGSVHLSGIFLEDAGQGAAYASQDEVREMVEADSSDDDSDNESTAPGSCAAVAAIPEAPAPAVKLPPVTAAAFVPASNPPIAPKIPTTQTDVVDLAKEKNQSLSLLNSLFGARDGDWGGRESVGSDVDEEELLKIGGTTIEDDDGIEFVPMDVDIDVREPLAPNVPPSPKSPEVSRKATPPLKKVSTQATKLKDLFVSREEDVGFSLLGHLDLDLELDEELVHAGEPEPAAYVEAPPPVAASFAMTPSHAQITLDPKQPLFFPLPTSFSFSSATGAGLSFSTKARQRDILDVGKDNGWNTHFYRTEADTDEAIREKWEKEKVELTREWNRRWREAGKVRKRRGGGDGD